MKLLNLFPLAVAIRAVSAAVIPDSSTAYTTPSIPSTTSIKASFTSTPGCTNGPTSRGCWSRGFDISTDVEQSWPVTGKTVTYHLEITNTTLSPEGTPKQMMVVNGQYPGPVITANWGDTLKIKVKNSLENNGTSMHWHGIRQLNTNTEDGVDGVTECPIPFGATKEYTFLATQHGTSWYHSHLLQQYGDGVVGPIVINGPAVENYDEDLGTFPITDFHHISMYQGSLISRAGRPPAAANGLINGKMKNVAKTAGSYSTKSLEPGKKYRLRLINTSVENHFRVSLDGHKFTVIQADFVPIVPYDTNWLFLAIGQRYDVVFTASETKANYWFRAEVQAKCGTNENNGNILAIFNNGVKVADPTTTKIDYTVSCLDEKTLVPYVAKSVPKEEFVAAADQKLSVTNFVGSEGFAVWTINGTGMKTDLGDPTLKYVKNDDTSYHQKSALQIYELPRPNTWQFFLVQNTSPINHPIHLHGHDFHLLGSSFGPGPFTKATIGGLNFVNPTRRDTAMLPGEGWIVIGFKTDNPGAWLFHCHIAWHVRQGMAIQFLERSSEIKSRMSLDHIEGECQAWDKWYKTSIYKD